MTAAKRLKLLLVLMFPLSLAAQTPVLKAHGPATGTYDTTGANFIGICEVAGSPTQPTDNKSNIYSLVGQLPQGGGFAGTYAYASFNPTVGTGHTFNVVQAGVMISFAGIASGPDQSAVSIPDASPNVAPPTGSITPSHINELIWACSALFGTGTSTVTGVTQLDRANLTNWTVQDGYTIQTNPAVAVSTSWAGSTPASTSVLMSFFSIANPGPLSVTTTNPFPELVAGVGGTVPLTANGGTSPYTWSLNAGTLPAHCSIVGQGVTCTSAVAAGVTTGLQFKVTDAASVTALSPSMTLPIAGMPIALGSSGCTSSGTQYVAYPGGCVLSATGGITPYAYNYTQGSGPRDTSPYAAVPPGLSLDALDGTVTGTNFGQGYYGTQYTVTDAYGAVATAVVTVQLAGKNDWMADVFPLNSIFHLKVTSLPLAAASLSDISTFSGAHMQILFGAGPLNTGLPNGIPMIHVPSGQASAAVTTVGGGLFSFSSGPIPPYMPVEGTSTNANPNCCYPGDAHGSVTILDGSGKPAGLYELWQAALTGSTWFDASNASWTNVQSAGSNAYGMLQPGHGATDLAGLPVGPLLLNADEVIGTGTPTTPNGIVRHPTRFTINQLLAYHVWPAVASAGAGIGGCTGGYVDPTTNNLLSQGPTTITPSATAPTSCTPIPIPGMTYRLKASVTNPGCASTSPQAAIVLQGFRDYGIIAADIGSGFFLIGTPDVRWVDSDLACLTNLTIDNFEAVNTQSVAALWPGDDSPDFVGSTKTTVGGGGRGGPISIIAGLSFSNGTSIQ